MFFVLFRLLAKAAALDRGVPFSLYQQVVMWCTMVALFSWIFKVFFIAFVRAAAAAVERYISRLSSSRGIMQLVDYYIHLDDALFPWWGMIGFFVTFLSLEASSVYLAKGQCIALFFSFTILVFTTSLPRVTPHPFVFFYIINIFL